MTQLCCVAIVYCLRWYNTILNFRFLDVRLSGILGGKGGSRFARIYNRKTFWQTHSVHRSVCRGVSVSIVYGFRIS